MPFPEQELRRRIYYFTQQLKKARTQEEQKYWQGILSESKAKLEGFKRVKAKSKKLPQVFTKHRRKSRSSLVSAIYSPKEVAKKTGFSQSTVYSWIYRGELRAIRRRASYRITEHDLNEFWGEYYG